MSPAGRVAAWGGLLSRMLRDFALVSRPSVQTQICPPRATRARDTSNWSCGAAAFHLTDDRAKRALPWCFRHLDKKILLSRLKRAAPRTAR